MNKEILEKAKAANSPEELFALAKAEGIEISPEQAEKYFKMLRDGGELSEDELANATGGGCSVFNTIRIHIDCPARDAGHPTMWQCRVCRGFAHTDEVDTYIDFRTDYSKLFCDHALNMKDLNCDNCMNLNGKYCYFAGKNVR